MLNETLKSQLAVLLNLATNQKNNLQEKVDSLESELQECKGYLTQLEQLGLKSNCIEFHWATNEVIRLEGKVELAKYHLENFGYSNLTECYSYSDVTNFLRGTETE